MVELRKRPAPAPAPPPPKKRSVPKAKPTKPEPAAVEPVAENAPSTSAPAAADSAAKEGPPKVGDTINLDDFGGEIDTHEGTKTTLGKLVEESKAGVVLFTYPKASTPGCTTQACFFRDSYASLTSTGLSIYGLSSDSPKANTTFKTKQNLPYSLLCDPAQTLIKAIGMKKAPKGTTRGVFVVDKSGKVLVAEPGGPGPTHGAVQRLVEKQVGGKEEDGEHKDGAEVAAEVGETAANLD